METSERIDKSVLVVDIFHVISFELGITLKPGMMIKSGIIDDFYSTYISAIDRPNRADLEYQKLVWEVIESNDPKEVRYYNHDIARRELWGKLSMWTAKYECYYMSNYERYEHLRR